MRFRASLIVIGVVVFLVSVGMTFSNAEAGSGPVGEAAVYRIPQPQSGSNDECLACHAQEGFSTQLKNGDTLPLTISPHLFEKSTHGMNDVACVTCHADISGYPHPEKGIDSARDVKLKYYTSCKMCHEEQFNLTLDSVHQKALASGNENAAVCADCHNPHTQQIITDGETGKLLDSARLHIPETCAQCHSEIYDLYRSSVHGKALTEGGNLDMPTCIDCHGVHNIQNPTEASFRNSTPYMCAKCHTNEELMSKYQLSTDVMDTYVADFHGTTVAIFDKSFPDQPTNKPVCSDCHGVHDIASSKDPHKGLKTRENLLARCQVCHPDATTNFPDSWMSHYIASPNKFQLVYYVNLFYKFFIPAVLLPMIALVMMDFGRSLINRFKKPKRKVKETSPKPVEKIPPVIAPLPDETKPSDKEGSNG